MSEYATETLRTRILMLEPLTDVIRHFTLTIKNINASPLKAKGFSPSIRYSHDRGSLGWESLPWRSLRLGIEISVTRDMMDERL